MIYKNYIIIIINIIIKNYHLINNYVSDKYLQTLMINNNNLLITV